MSKLALAFTTDGIHPRDRFAQWHDMACRSYAQHECKVDRPYRFGGKIEIGTLGHSTISIYENSAMHVWRTPQQVRLAPSDRIFICLQLFSTCTVSQLGREAALMPGDFCCVQTNWPYRFVYPSTSQQLVFDVPAREVQQRLGAANILGAIRVPGTDVLGSLASEYLKLLSPSVGKLSPEAAERIETQVLDLVALAISQFAPTTPVRLGSSSNVALARLHDAIEQKFTDPGAKCHDIAAAAGISVRYANALLAKNGTSLERLIKSRRLENSRLALEQGRRRSISDIAYGAGFSDLSHFSKAFKAAYKVSPSDYRRKPRRDDI